MYAPRTLSASPACGFSAALSLMAPSAPVSPILPGLSSPAGAEKGELERQESVLSPKMLTHSSQKNHPTEEMDAGASSPTFTSHTSAAYKFLTSRSLSDFAFAPLLKVASPAPSPKAPPAELDSPLTSPSQPEVAEGSPGGRQGGEVAAGSSAEEGSDSTEQNCIQNMQQIKNKAMPTLPLSFSKKSNTVDLLRLEGLINRDLLKPISDQERQLLWQVNVSCSL